LNTSDRLVRTALACPSRCFSHSEPGSPQTAKNTPERFFRNKMIKIKIKSNKIKGNLKSKLKYWKIKQKTRNPKKKFEIFVLISGIFVWVSGFPRFKKQKMFLIWQPEILKI
jgi:hypothetical protein